MKRLLLLALMLTACSPGPVFQQLQGDKIYKRDVKILFEGSEYNGVAVLPRRDKYNLEMIFAGELDLVTFKTCHREVTQDDVNGGKIFGKKNRFSFTYTPVAPIETEFCPVEVGGFEREKGRHSWAYIDFRTPLETLPAVVLCNGSRTGFDGVSVCQALSGLIAKIIFTAPVSAVRDPDCPTEPYSTDGMAWTLLVNQGRCTYSFREKGGQKNWHRLTTVGYQDILIRRVE